MHNGDRVVSYIQQCDIGSIDTLWDRHIDMGNGRFVNSTWDIDINRYEQICHFPTFEFSFKDILLFNDFKLR